MSEKMRGDETSTDSLDTSISTRQTGSCVPDHEQAELAGSPHKATAEQVQETAEKVKATEVTATEQVSSFNSQGSPQTSPSKREFDKKRGLALRRKESDASAEFAAMLREKNNATVPRAASVDLPLRTAYIHDDFEQPSTMRRQNPSASAAATTSRLLPSHLVFDIRRTQVPSLQTRQRSRVSTAAEPVRGFKNVAAATRFPGESQHRPLSRSGVLTPLKSSALDDQRKPVNATFPGQAQDAGETMMRPSTSLGLIQQSGKQIGNGAGGFSFMSSMVGANSMSLDDLRSSWVKSGAVTTDSLVEPPEITASRMLMTMPKGTKSRYSSSRKEKRKDMPTQRQDSDDLWALDEVNRTRREYKAEIEQPDGTPIPTRNRKQPHIVLNTFNPDENERVMSILSVVRKYEYIAQSPGHSKAFSLSQRGYVEQHRKGLTEFETLPNLALTMTQYSMAMKLPIFSRFREYKVLRHWDFAVRRRKFNERLNVAEKIFLQARREHWACVQTVVAECVQLTQDVLEKDLRAPPTGWPVEHLKSEILRRREILQDALDTTRTRITDYLEEFFSSISKTANVEKLRAIYKHNRKGNTKKATMIASEDMMLLARIYCLCEHIVCQTATQLYNNEVNRLVRLLEECSGGVLNVDASMHVAAPHAVKIELPHSEADKCDPKNIAEIAIIPSGPQILEFFSVNFSTLQSALAFTMRGRLLSGLERYIASEIFLPFASKKPDYTAVVTVSVDYLAFHARLAKIIGSAHDSAIAHCHSTMGHLRILFAYMEGFSVSTDEQKRALIDKYPEEVQQYAAWSEAIIRMAGQDHDCGALRLKYRRIKMQMQDKLQQDIIDSRFEMFFEAVSFYIGDLKKSVNFFVKGLEGEITSYDGLVQFMNTSEELDQCLALFSQRVQTSLQQREVLAAQYKSTTRFLNDPQSKIQVPMLNPHLADKMLEERQAAQVKMIAHRESHVELIKSELDICSRTMSDAYKLLRDPQLQSVTANSKKARQKIEEVQLQLPGFRQRGAILTKILYNFKMPTLNLKIIDETSKYSQSLDVVWKAVMEWHAVTSEMRNTAIRLLQGMDVETKVNAMLQLVENTVKEHQDIPLAKELAGANKEFLEIWPSIRRLTHKSMKQAHFDDFLKKDDGAAELVNNNLDLLTIQSLANARHLEHVEKLIKIHNKAVEEQQMFALVDKLRASIDGMAVNVMRENENIWVEGLVEMTTVIQDDAILISSIKQSSFRNMVYVELESLCRRNSDSNGMLSRLKFCQESWNALRIMQVGKNLPGMDSNIFERYHAAEAKWKKCIAALSRDRGSIPLAHIEFAHLLRVQEVVELFSKCIEEMMAFRDYLVSQCWRLSFVPIADAMHIAAMFSGPGPKVAESVLMSAFPNIHAIRVNSDYRPELITSAYYENLVIVSQDLPLSWIETVQNFLPSVHKAVKGQLVRGLESVRDGTLFKHRSDHTCQITILALQVSWSTKLTRCPDKTNHSACEDEMRAHVQSLFDVYGSSTTASILQRRKFQSCIIVSHTWRDALDAMLTEFAYHQDIEMQTLMPCLQTYEYDNKKDNLAVHYGPFVYNYGFDFIDGALVTPGFPTSHKYNLFLLSCLQDVACGFIQAEDCHSRKETTLNDLARIFGLYCDTLDCQIGHPVEAICECVKGAMHGGSWLLLTHVDKLSNHTINVIAKAILRCIHDLKAQTHAVTTTLPSGAQIEINMSPGIFLMGRSRIDGRLPAELAANLRPITIQTSLPHRRVIARVLLEAMGFERATFLATLLDCTYRIMQLRLPTSQHFSFKFHVMKDVIAAAVPILKDLRIDASIRKLGATRPDSAMSKQSDTDSTEETDDADSNLDVKAVLISFLSHKRRILDAVELNHCLEATRQVFKETGIDLKHSEESLPIDSKFALQAQTVVTSVQQIATPSFINNCAALMECLKLDARPVILVGAPFTGKSHCVKVVSHALTVDLSHPVKDALPKTFTKVVAPLAYFSLPTGAPSGQDAEAFDYRSVSQLHEYVQWFCRSECKPDFTFNDRWLILDCPNMRFVDGIASHVYRQNEKLQVELQNGQLPRLMIETCSLEQAAPSSLAWSRIIYFSCGNLGWREIFMEWTEKLALLLPKRTMQDIVDLVGAHVQDIVDFIEAECKCIQPISWISAMRCFCEIMHYHFFLGKPVATRRTVAFVRAVFVFAIPWSFGAVLQLESRDKFDAWFRHRVEDKKLLRFPIDTEDEGNIPNVWEFFVSFHTMSLNIFKGKQEDDEKVIQATEQTMIFAWTELDMTRMLWEMFHTQRQNTFFFAPESGGKTRFLEWIFAIHNSNAKGWGFSQTSMQKRPTTSNFCSWLADELTVRPDRLFEKPDYNGFFVDDVHLALESARQPTAVAELFRSMLERKGILNKSLIEEQADLDKCSFTMLGDVTRLDKGTLRMLNHFFLIPIVMNGSHIEDIANVPVQPFKKANLGNHIKAVIDKVPDAMIAVYEFIKENLVAQTTDEILMLWHMDHMLMTMTNLVLLPIWNMDSYELCLRFIWHETMRVYLDRFVNIGRVQKFRTDVNEVMAKAMGGHFRRRLREASEIETFHVLLPGSTQASSAVDWDMHEYSPQELTIRALRTIEMRSDIQGWITCIEDFPRHLSHVLRIYRPDHRVQGCVLLGPKGSGKLLLLQTAAAMCNYEVYVEKPETALETSIVELRKALNQHLRKMFVFCPTGAVVQSAESAQYLLYLMKGHGLEEYEKAGSMTVRIAFTYDISMENPVNVKTNSFPSVLLEISKHCTVDWMKGWSDDAILRAAKYKYMQESKSVKIGLSDEHPVILFKLHRMVEQAVLDILHEGMALVFPPPLLINEFVSGFLQCAARRHEQMAKRAAELNQSLRQFRLFKDNHDKMKGEHERLVPIVKDAVNKHLKKREDCLNYDAVASRVRRIAEDEATTEIRLVLYGDAPGPEILHEYEVAKSGYLTATRCVADLNLGHLTQLEMLAQSYDLEQLLTEALCTLFEDELGYIAEGASLRQFAPIIRDCIAKYEVKNIGMTKVKKLHAYTSDVRFTPEKYFALNKAAGVLCNWVRAVERYGHTYEWINPQSESNQNQSLDRVREMTRNPIMAIETIEASVKATRDEQEEMRRAKEEALVKTDLLVKQMHQSNVILNAIAPEKVEWTYKLKLLADCEATLIGDSMLYAAYTTYLLSFSYSDRLTVIHLLAEALADAGIQTTPHFGLESFYEPFDCTTAAKYIWDYTATCLRENSLLIAACPKIPLLIDPIGQGLDVLHIAATHEKSVGSEFGGLMRYSLSAVADVKSFLEKARRSDCPALIEHAEELMEEILSVLRMNPHLRLSPSEPLLEEDEVQTVRLCRRYTIILLTSRKAYLPPAEAFNYVSVCDLTPDLDALKEMCLDQIICNLDKPQHTKMRVFWRSNHEMKDKIREISTIIAKLLCSENIVEQVNHVKADLYVETCKRLMQNRTKLQTHALHGLDLLRPSEFYKGIAEECAIMLSKSWDICAMAAVNIFGLDILRKSFLRCPQVSDLEYGSVAFKDTIIAASECMISSMTLSMMQAVPVDARPVCLLILKSNHQNKDRMSELKDALEYLAHEFNKAGLSRTTSHVLCTRNIGLQKLFSGIGWTVFRAIREHLGPLHMPINNSIQKMRTKWLEFGNSSTVSMQLPDIGVPAVNNYPESTYSDQGSKAASRSSRDYTISHLLMTCVLAPHKLSLVMEKLIGHELTLSKARIHEELSNCSRFSGLNQSKIVSVIVARDVPHWHAVMQVLLNFAFDADELLEERRVACPLVVDCFTTPEDLEDILQTAATSPRWVVAKVGAGFGEWYSKLVRRMTAFAQGDGVQGDVRPITALAAGDSGFATSFPHCKLMAKSRLCVAVDATAVASASGVLCDSISVMAENSSDPRQLMGAIIADCFFKAKSLQTCEYWRAVVGLCYMHAAMVQDTETTASSTFYNSPPVTLQSLLYAARLLSYFQHYTEGKVVRITRMLVTTVCYPAQFEQRKQNLVDLLDSCLSVSLFRDSSQLVVFNTVLDAPDASFKRGWRGLIEYSRSLCSTVTTPWHASEPPCLVVDKLVERSIKSSAYLERTRTKLYSPPTSGHNDVVEAVTFLCSILPKTEFARMDPRQANDLPFVDNTLRVMMIHEFDLVFDRVYTVTNDLQMLLSACNGRQAFDDATFELYHAIAANKVVERWDKYASTGIIPVQWYIEDLKSRFEYLYGKLAEYGILRGKHGFRLVPYALNLHHHSKVKELLDLYVLAWQQAESQNFVERLMVPRQLRFAVISSPPPELTKVNPKTFAFPMKDGVIVRNFIFRGVKYNPETRSLEKLSGAEHTFGAGAVDLLLLTCVDMASLPKRISSKANGLYWVPLPVYRRPLRPQAWKHGVNGDKGDAAQTHAPIENPCGGIENQYDLFQKAQNTEQLELLFEIYISTSITPLAMERSGACAFLNGGIEENCQSVNAQRRT